jgi:hypothetical protein
MKVKIKSFDVDMEVKNRGIEFEVKDNNGNHLGDCVLTKSKIIWCKGRRDRANGVELTWAKFIAMMEKDI